MNSSFLVKPLRPLRHAAFPLLLLACATVPAQDRPAPAVADSMAAIGGGGNVYAPTKTPAAPANPDPTKASAKMKAALAAGGSAFPEMSVKGIVLGAARAGGTVMFSIDGNLALARPGVPFTIIADGEARKLVVRQISSEGIEIEAPAEKETALIPSFGPITEQRGGLAGDLDYVEFRDLPLLDALQMLSDQTGMNFSASSEANKMPVNAMLRNVSASSVVEELCKSHGLWFKRDERSGITRIMTVAEFEKDLVGYREEQTEVFTLKYPNVNEVAFAIADLFGDRVRMSQGAEESDEQMRRDLEQRFDRFDLLNERTQTAQSLNGNTNGYGGGNNNTTVGRNVNGYSGSSGNYSSFGSTTGGGGGRPTYNNGRTGNQTQEDDELFRNLTPEQAQRVQRALSKKGDGAEVEGLRKKQATIFVTSSRRNNQIVVRTADSGALSAIRSLVTRMDVPQPLVLLEVKVLSVELDNNFRSAFDYQFSNNTIGSSFSQAGISQPAPGGAFSGVANAIASTGSASAGFSSSDMTFVVVSNNFRAQMQVLAEKNRLKTLSTPTLLTANNEVSRIFLGEQRPIVTNISSQTILTDNNVATSPNTTTQLQNVGTTLLITPNINSDRTVTLRLVQDNSSIEPGAATIPVVTTSNTTNAIGGNNSGSGVQNVAVDVVASRTVSGTFVAKDGMAIAIGGLIQEVNNDSRQQVPLLGDIPGVGILFRRTVRTKTRQELVIMIRPYVMSTPADGERISRDLLDRLAPNSVKELVDEGFLPNLPPPPMPKPKKRPAPSAAATQKIEATPTPKPVRWQRGVSGK